MRFKPYPKYKPSGVEWLGEVPMHWGATRLKRISDVRLSNVDKHTVEGQQAIKLCNYVDVYKNNRITSKIDFMVASASDEQIARLTLAKGDVIITKDSETPSDIGVPALVDEGISDLVCGYHLALIRPTSSLGQYLSYLFQSHFVRSVFEVEATGMTRYALGKYSIENLSFTAPTVDEQSAIATFLDRETAKIDTLISKQEKLIELLKEKRQAIISHAVTKGLNPKAKMKDSGIEWLGEVPEHWDVRRLSTLTTKITNGYVGPTRDILVDSGIRYLQSLHIKENRISFDPPYYVDNEWSVQHSKSILAKEDVLVVQTGDIGQAACISDEFIGCNCHALIILSPKRGTVIGEWISWGLNSDYGFNTLLSIQTGALHPHLNCGNVKDVAIPLPPVDEQNKIIDYLKSEMGKIDGLITKSKIAIELQIEHRSALISAAVTGKIDVR